jgi:hypothetical protein
VSIESMEKATYIHGGREALARMLAEPRQAGPYTYSG